MTIIKINGGFWGWEPIETLERLYPLFEQYTLDPIYEWYGNFVNRKPEWQRSEERQAYQGCTVISGRFLHYGNFFYIVTDEEELIQRFERLVADNKATQSYFRLLERRNEDGDCVIHCFGALGQTGVNNDDVRYICGFYGIPYSEDWRREETRDAGDSFYLLIKTDD